MQFPPLGLGIPSTSRWPREWVSNPRKLWPSWPYSSICHCHSSTTLPLPKRNKPAICRTCHRSLDQFPRDLSHQTRLRCSDILWRWISRILSVYLSLLCCVPILEAHDHPPPLATIYLCEDVNNYYAQVGGLKGESLKEKLNSIIHPHSFLSDKQVWKALEYLDAGDVENPETSEGVVEIYSLKVVPKSLAGKPEGWNREHLWPRSYGLTDRFSLSDVHNIRPSDVNVNSSRGNKYFGECSQSNKCLRPANKEASTDTETDRERWTPPKRVRGDIARALMYMAVCYGYKQPDRGPNLRLSDFPSFEKKEMGLLSTLIIWNKLDPPSYEERLRNERVCRIYQHNRNPFVDHPEYADKIWKKHS